MNAKENIVIRLYFRYAVVGVAELYSVECDTFFFFGLFFKYSIQALCLEHKKRVVKKKEQWKTAILLSLLVIMKKPTTPEMDTFIKHHFECVDFCAFLRKYINNLYVMVHAQRSRVLIYIIFAFNKMKIRFEKHPTSKIFLVSGVFKFLSSFKEIKTDAIVWRWEH